MLPFAKLLILLRFKWVKGLFEQGLVARKKLLADVDWRREYAWLLGNLMRVSKRLISSEHAPAQTFIGHASPL